jgi:hypothetical protein
MGLFKSKKDEKRVDFSQEIPDFKPISNRNENKLPALPKEEKELFPSYKSEFGSIKKEISKPMFSAPKLEVPKMRKKVEQVPEMPIETERPVMGDKPIYVKMEQYKEAMSQVDKIKALCNEADKSLSEISNLRSEEDKELHKWQEEIDKIKDKILLVDKKLFEV